MFSKLLKKNNEIDKSYLKEIEDFCDTFNTSIEEAEARLREAVGEDCLYFTSKETKGQQLEALYFSIVSIISEDIENILEIGTGIGIATDMLSKLFPKAHIYTLDIPKQDSDFNKLAQRREEQEEQIFKSNINRTNITFFEKNSFYLPSLEIPKQFGFIWLDGGHSNPAVAWDTMYAYNHTKKDGFLFMHDYNRPNTEVKQVVDNVADIVDEEIHFLPFAGYDRNTNTCWLRKE